ncbi:putative leader peptide [Kitasatospora sp. MMS16-BH015]
MQQNPARPATYARLHIDLQRVATALCPAACQS